jgi:signal transduction histidine kinase/DNA-binding response OmpR family regulator
MDKKEKQGVFESSINIVKFVLIFLLMFNAFVFIYFGIINGADVWDSEPIRFIESWMIREGDGNSFKTGRSLIAEEEFDKEIVIYSTLPTDVRDNEYLFFVTRTDIAVYIDGELRKDFVEKRDVNIPGGLVTKFYMNVPLIGSDAGKEVKMIRSKALKDEQMVPETFIGTRSGALSYLIHEDGLSFFLAAIVLIFSVVVIIVSFVLRFWYKIKINMLYGALGIFVTAAWLITDSFICPFVFRVYYVHGLLNYMFGLMIPFAPAVYLNYIQNGRYKKSMLLLLIVSGFNAVVWPFLHFTEIVPFYNIRTIANAILALVTVIAIVILTVDAVKGNIGKYKYTFTGFFGFLIGAIIELVIVLVVRTTNATLPMVAGLGFLLTFVVIQQVADLRKINMEKQHAIDISEAKTRFLASMSHEIRTPINAIMGMNEMILRENKDKVIGEYSRSIKASGKMLLMLVNDVLDFSKIEAGKLEINETSFHLSDMLYDVVAIVKERADEKTLVFMTEIMNEIPNDLLSDEFRLRQILVNLLSNAVKYTDKGMVTLRLGGKYTDDGYDLCFTVKDTGKGIKKEEIANLFEPFSRADVRSNINVEGTGLGLAIVKSIVDSMNGTIEVESVYGSGSNFNVNIPVKVISRDPLKSDFMNYRADYEPAPDVCDFEAPDAKILAVDDNKSNLKIVKLFLKRTGIKPDLCSNGKKALEMCKEKKYDLILLDHMMPAPDGIETLHNIKNDPKSLNKDTKAVVLTANAVAGSRQMYMEEGFEEYITKPIDSKVLEKTVKALLPKEKVIPVSPANEVKVFKTEDGILEFQPENLSKIKERLTSIDGLDYDVAMRYCAGDEEILEEFLKDLEKEYGKRAVRMRKSLADKDINAYRIEAHSIKSSMATLGLRDFSERAKKHEYAAKDNNTDFIYAEAESFIKDYVEICKKLTTF